MLHRIYHLKIQCGDKVKGMTVACEVACTMEEMAVAANSRFGADRVVEIISKQEKYEN